MISVNQWKAIYEAIFNPNTNQISIDGKVYSITKATNGCRHIIFEGWEFIEQNKKTSSAYANMAKSGTKILWIRQPGTQLYKGRIQEGKFIKS